MADIDMIPRSYRDGVRLRRTLRMTAAVLALVVGGAGAVHGALRWHGAGLQERSALLQAAAGAAQATRARAAEQRALLEQQAHTRALLLAVRRGGELAALAAAIDGALPANAWLTRLALARDLQLAAPGAALPDLDATRTRFATAAGTDLLIDSRVELSGQAADYQAITTFLAALARSPAVHDVRLQSSGANHEAQAIDFRATLALAPAEQTP